MTGIVNLGDTAKDIVTGFRGIVMARISWLHGCDRLILEPTTLSPTGELQKQQVFDEQRIEVCVRNTITIPDQTNATYFDLGVKAKDMLTGFEGIIVAQTIWLGNSITYTIEPITLDKDGQPRTAYAFESSRIQLIAVQAVPVSKNAVNDRPGGPPRNEDASIRR